MKPLKPMPRRRLNLLFAAFTLFVVCSLVDANATIGTVDAGGRRSTSSNYAMDVSMGGIGGISSAISPVTTTRHGYVGQLYEVTGMVVMATPSSVSESSNSQLSATATLNDATFLVVAGSNVNWSTPTFPIASIDATGLLTPASVYTDTTGTVSGYFLGASNSTTLLVIDTNPDNFGIYANDNIPDAWQIQYFGVNNQLGLAGADADGTGQDNLFKYLAGLNPTNPASVLRITAVTRSGNDVRVTWTDVGGHKYVLQSTKLAAGTRFSTNLFADAGPLITASGTGESTTNYVDVGAAYAPVLTAPGAAIGSTNIPSTVNTSATGTRGLADSSGNAISGGSLLMLGTFSISESVIQSNFYAGNLSAIMSAFTPYANAFTVSDGTGVSASWDVSLSAAGYGGQKIYLLAIDKHTFTAATHLGIFTAPSWVFPSDGDQISIDLEDVTDFVIGAHGGPLSVNVGLGPPYTFTDTARLSALPGRELFYRIRLVP